MAQLPALKSGVVSKALKQRNYETERKDYMLNLTNAAAQKPMPIKSERLVAQKKDCPKPNMFADIDLD